MKIEKQPSPVAVLNPQTRTQAFAPPPMGSRVAEAKTAHVPLSPELRLSKDAGFSLQLNQQLSALQASHAYLSELGGQLGALKLGLSRQLSQPQQDERKAIAESAKQVNQLLDKRAKLTANSLDANLNLRLHEPVRSRFSLQGLESIEAIQESGRETLLFRAGRQIAEPVAVVLDDNLSAAQVLRRFNASLGQTGIRAELDAEGALKFTAPESDWLKARDHLVVQGEGKLFERGYQKLASHTEGVGNFAIELQQQSPRELRQYLDQVVAQFDRVASLREQLVQRQNDVQAFLARQENQDDREWAINFASRVFQKDTQAQGYNQISRGVAAQATLNRFAVVSLLS